MSNENRPGSKVSLTEAYQALGWRVVDGFQIDLLKNLNEQVKDSQEPSESKTPSPKKSA